MKLFILVGKIWKTDKASNIYVSRYVLLMIKYQIDD